MTDVLIRREQRDTDRGNGHINMEAEFEVILPKAKGHLGPLEIVRGKKDSYLELSKGLWPCRTLLLDF